MNALDTNVFIYSLDADEPKKQFQARELIDRLLRAPETAILLWQVAGELLNNLRKREFAGKISANDVEAHFNNFLGMFPLIAPNGGAAFPVYFEFRRKFSLSHWDAMLLASSKVAGVTTVFSEDMDDGTDYDGILVVNPFA